MCFSPRGIMGMPYNNPSGSDVLKLSGFASLALTTEKYVEDYVRMDTKFKVFLISIYETSSKPLYHSR